MRCARCGREATLVDGVLCPDCYLEVRGAGRPPQQLRLVVCPRCGSYRFQGRWYPPPGDDIADVVGMVFQVSFKPWEHVEYYRVESVELVEEEYSGRTLASIELAVKLRGVEGERRKHYLVPVRIDYQLCPACFRKAAGAPQAIVQVRSWRGRLSGEERRSVEQVLGSMGEAVKEAVIEVEERREGIDIKFVDANIARSVAARLRSRLGAKVTESHKVVGRRSDGKPRSRVTLSVRLPFFRPGTLAFLGDELVVVDEVRGGRVYFHRVGSRRRNGVRVEEAWERLEALREDQVSYGVVAAVEPGWIHVQLVEPSYEYLEIPFSHTRLEEGVGEGDEVAVVERRGRYYIVPRGLVEETQGVRSGRPGREG